MITSQMITQNSALAGLTEEQIEAITTLSQNDEAAVIAGKVKEIHGMYDQDVYSVTGVEKPPGVKSYEHVKSELKRLKAEAGGSGELKNRVRALEGEREQLLKQIKEGSGDKAIKSQLEGLEQRLADKEVELKQVRGLVKEKELEVARVMDEKEKEILGLHTESEFARALAGVKFKDTVSEGVRKIVLKAAQRDVAERYKVGVEEVNGERKLIFRDKETDMVITDPENLQRPATAKGMLLGVAELAEIIDRGRKQEGGGTSGAGGGSGGGSVGLNLNGGMSGKSRVEKDRMIRDALAAKGLAAGTEEFQTKLNQAYEEFGMIEK